MKLFLESDIHFLEFNLPVTIGTNQIAFVQLFFYSVPFPSHYDVSGSCFFGRFVSMMKRQRIDTLTISAVDTFTPIEFNGKHLLSALNPHYLQTCFATHGNT